MSSFTKLFLYTVAQNVAATEFSISAPIPYQSYIYNHMLYLAWYFFACSLDHKVILIVALVPSMGIDMQYRRYVYMYIILI